MVTKDEVCSPLVFFYSIEKKNIFFYSTYCHILQYNEDEIKSLDDVWIFIRNLIWKFLFVFVKVAFDIEQLNFDDTNKFPDWRLTVDVELERFRAQYVVFNFIDFESVFFLLDFKMNIFGHECLMLIVFFIFLNGGQNLMHKKVN